MQSYTVRPLKNSNLPAAQALRREVFAPQNPNGSQPENATALPNAQQSPSCDATAFPGALQSPSCDATAFPGALQSQPRDATASSNAQQSPSCDATAFPGAQQSPSRSAIALPSAQKTLPKNPVEDSLTDLEAMQSTRIYGAFEGETLIGLLEMRNSQISLFFVREEFRNQGAGRALLNRLLADMPPIFPNTPFVLPLNAPAEAVSLYARLGFLPSGGECVLNGVRLQPLVHHLHHAVEVRAGDIHLVDVGQAGHVILARLPPHGFALGLHAALCAEYGHRAVEHAQRALDLDREVHVAGRVDQIDLIAAPFAGRGRRGDRNAALLFLLHPVHRRHAFVHLAQAVRATGVVQNSLGRRCFTGIDMRHNADIANMIQRMRSRHS